MISFAVSISMAMSVLVGGELEFKGAFPADVKTISIVMPASILPKAKFDRGKAALEKAGYRVKVAKRIDFKRVASAENRARDFEEAWLDPETDLVLCARGGTGAHEILDRLDWAKLRARRQRVLGFSNITRILNAMLKQEAGRPISGPSVSHLLYADADTIRFLPKAVGSEPIAVQVNSLKAGACRGTACGGHISNFLQGLKNGTGISPEGRIVFLESIGGSVETTRKMLDELLRRGYLAKSAGIVFGDISPTDEVWRKQKKENPQAADEALAVLKRDFAAKAPCPVFDGYPYGHVPKSYAIDFLRTYEITADGKLTAAPLVSTPAR